MAHFPHPINSLRRHLFGASDSQKLDHLVNRLNLLSKTEKEQLGASLEELKTLVWRDPELDDLAAMWSTPESRRVFRSQDAEFDRFNININYVDPFAKRVSELIKKAFGEL